MKTREQLFKLLDLYLEEVTKRRAAIGLSPVTRQTMAEESQRVAWPGVYFVQWGDFVKIGCAANVVWRRRDLEYGIPTGRVVPLGYIPVFSGMYAAPMGDMYDHEFAIHELFSDERVRGEWFRYVPKLQRFIERYAYEWPMEVER